MQVTFFIFHFSFKTSVPLLRKSVSNPFQIRFKSAPYIGDITDLKIKILLIDIIS